MHVAQCEKSATISHQSDTQGRLGGEGGEESLGGPHTQWVVAREEVREQMKENQHVNAQPRARQSRGCRTLIELMETASRSSTVPGGSGSRHSSRGCTERFTIGMAANRCPLKSTTFSSMVRGTELHKLLRLIPSSRILLEFECCGSCVLCPRGL